MQTAIHFGIHKSDYSPKIFIADIPLQDSKMNFYIAFQRWQIWEPHD